MSVVSLADRRTKTQPPPSAKDRARAYCISIGADPDEVVWGQYSAGEWVSAPRWCWYAGA